MKKYDLVVIGSGPAGEKAAVKAAYFGYSVAVIECGDLGGAGVNTGTLPSKTLKETALYYSGHDSDDLYGVNRTLERSASIQDFMYRKELITRASREAVRFNLELHKVDIYLGTAEFIDSHHISVKGKQPIELEAAFFLIATGSYPHNPADIPFDRKRVHDSDSILHINRFPDSICIVGAGVIGCEYATIFATMGSKVHLVNRTDKIIPFVDQQIAECLRDSMTMRGVEMLFNDSVETIDVPTSQHDQLQLKMRSGLCFGVDMFLYAAGRNGRTRDLHLERVGIQVNERQQLVVDEALRTKVAHIYAAGDVIGFPSLANTSMEQGRLAVAHMFGITDVSSMTKSLPYGIYTIPEVSMTGLTEEEATKRGIDIFVGSARFQEMPRGQIMGAGSGLLKLVFDRDTLTVIGVHIIGPQAAELIHYGLQLIENQRSTKDIIASVFNYPTLHDLYKYACFDALGNLSGHKVKL